MFNSLKKKLSSWLGKPESEEKKPKPAKAPKKKQAKSPTPKSSKKKQEEKPEIPKEKKEEIQAEVLKQADQEAEETGTLEKIEAPKDPKEKTSFFSKITKTFTTSELTQSQFDEIFSDLEMILLENNVALEVVDKIRSELEKDLVGIEVKKAELQNSVIESLKSAILSVLQDPPNIIEQIKEHKKNSKDPYIIVFFGINGSGKTTNLAKLAHLLKSQDISCVLGAADTFRAASIEQLKTHASSLDLPVITQDYGSDPAAVAFDTISYAKKNSLDCALIDTAGRMYTKSNLIKEMEKIIRISKPNLKIFVGESITGNDATEQAKTFSEAIGIDGIILSKADVDEKAGTILSVSHITNKPIYFLGTGQDYPDLKPFKKSEVLKNLGLD